MKQVSCYVAIVIVSIFKHCHKLTPLVGHSDLPLAHMLHSLSTPPYQFQWHCMEEGNNICTVHGLFGIIMPHIHYNWNLL